MTLKYVSCAPSLEAKLTDMLTVTVPMVRVNVSGLIATIWTKQQQCLASPTRPN